MSVASEKHAMVFVRELLSRRLMERQKHGFPWRNGRDKVTGYSLEGFLIFGLDDVHQLFQIESSVADHNWFHVGNRIHHSYKI